MNYEKNSSQISDVTCFVIERPYNYRFRHQSTPDRERLLFVKRGCVTVRSDEQAVTANQGEYISISAGLDTVAEYKGDDNVIIMLRFMGTLDSDNPGIRLFSRNRVCPASRSRRSAAETSKRSGTAAVSAVW